MAGIPFFFLFKFGERQHMESLASRGLLHLKRLDHFQKLEEPCPSPLRADPWEGVDVVLQPERLVRVQFGDIEIPPEDLVGPVLISRGGNSPPHIYCMYALTEPHMLRCHRAGVQPVDPRNAEFGSHAVVVHNKAAFLARVDEAFSSRHLDVNRGLVQYVPETHHGELGPFMKRDRFEHQCEARFVVGGHDGETLNVELGSLRDIVEVGPAVDLLKDIRYAVEPLDDDAA